VPLHDLAKIWRKILMTTLEKIQELITEQLDLEAGEVKATTNIREDIDADSLDLFQIINDIEDEFDIEIEDEEKINTVQDLVDYVEANKD
jgi:acyl carrier protein